MTPQSVFAVDQLNKITPLWVKSASGTKELNRHFGAEKDWRVTKNNSLLVIITKFKSPERNNVNPKRKQKKCSIISNTSKENYGYKEFR